jgi:hypothetical protein
MSTQPSSDGTDGPSIAADSGALLGYFDFSYQHYALGDLLTLQIELATRATEQGLHHVDVVAMVNPKLPAAAFQWFITPDNYLTHFDNIVPIFTCNPMLRSLQLLRDAGALNLTLQLRRRRGWPIWPPLRSHLKMQQKYPIGHQHLNAFHARHGHLPQLRAPRGFEAWARRFHGRELGGRPLAVINPRQSSLTGAPAAIPRDAPLDCWYQFIDAVAARRPDQLFVMVGGYREWEHRLLRRRNVFIPRAQGLTLAHELALLRIADLFMGSSSGFATYATFTGIPYAVVNVEPRFAEHAGIEVGGRHYPFARPNQILAWGRETTDQLLALFEELTAGPAAGGSGASVSAAVPDTDHDTAKAPRS